MKQTTWKKLKRTILLKHPRLNVYEDDVQLPNGVTTKYIHFGNHHDAAEVIAVNDQGKILVQREYSYPPNKWLYQFPGGGVEKDETPQQGALRELAEEGKLTGKLKDIGWFYINNRRWGDKFYVFIATDLSSATASEDPEEDIESYWFSEQEVDQMIAEGKIVNFSFLAGWALYKAHKSN